MIKFFWMPKEVWYYVVIPVIIILLSYIIFDLLYRRKRGTYYYNYVVDYVYSTFGIVFCALLLCLLLGYSIATFQILITNNVLQNYLVLAIILAILPIVPFCFLIYVISIYLKNLKRKEKLDEKYDDYKNIEITNEDNSNLENKSYVYQDVELVKKK